VWAAKKRESIMKTTILLMILSSLIPPASPGIGVAQDPAHDDSAQSTIVVWKVGSPHQGDTPKGVVPRALLTSAAAMGYTLKLETFPARGFAQIFLEAVRNHTEPDILAFDNYGIIDGIVTGLGTFAGIGSDQDIRKSLIRVTESFESLQDGRGGWEFLTSTSRNYRQARSLAMAGLECKPELDRSPTEVDAGALEAVKTFSLSATHAFFERDQKKLDELSGGKYPGDSFHVPESASKIHESRICGLWGNELVAFVNSVVIYENDLSLGKRNMLIVAQRPPSKGWRLNVISEHPVVISELYKQVSALSRGRSDDSIKAPELVSPPHQARFDNRFPRSSLPDLEWTSAGSNVVAYLVEAQFNYNRSPWSSGNFWVYPGSRNEKTIKEKAEFGVGAQPHRWRVWAITDGGEARISAWRTIIYTR
jgi:hypothetical protein